MDLGSGNWRYADGRALPQLLGPDPWSILAGPTSYGLIECEITRYLHLVNGPWISVEKRARLYLH